MKEFWKSAIILWSYGQDCSGTIFWLTVCVCIYIPHKHAPSLVFKQAVREAATLCPRPCKLAFDLLTLKVVSESRVTWNTSLPILVFLGLSVLDLGPMYTTDRRQTDVRCASSLNAPYRRGGGVITVWKSTSYNFHMQHDEETWHQKILYLPTSPLNCCCLECKKWLSATFNSILI